MNALTLVSGLLESFSEAETRFVKVADKECEGVSGELKKWFKKLAVRFVAIVSMTDIDLIHFDIIRKRKKHMMNVSRLQTRRLSRRVGTYPHKRSLIVR